MIQNTLLINDLEEGLSEVGDFSVPLTDKRNFQRIPRKKKYQISPSPEDSATESEYQRMVTKDRTPTARPWPEIIYDNDIDPTLEADDGSWPPLAAYKEWWEIPGIAKFNNEANAALALAAVNSIAPIKAALAEIGKGIDLIDCSGPAANQNIAAVTKLILPELKRALAALTRMEQP